MQLGPNPTVDVLKLHRKAKPHEPWPAEIIERFKLEAGAVAHLALLLLLYTGQRVGDVAAMRWDRYDGDGITVRQQKTDTLLWIPCHPALKAALDRTERKSEFILTTQYGRGFRASSLSYLVRCETTKLDARQYTAHGLRKNASIALAEAGCTPHQIMAITGHKSMKLVLHYTQQVAQRKLAQQAMDRMGGREHIRHSASVQSR